MPSVHVAWEVWTSKPGSVDRHVFPCGEAQARELFKSLYFSRVLFSPELIPVEQQAGVLDLHSAGVDAILKASSTGSTEHSFGKVYVYGVDGRCIKCEDSHQQSQNQYGNLCCSGDVVPRVENTDTKFEEQDLQNHDADQRCQSFEELFTGSCPTLDKSHSMPHSRGPLTQSLTKMVVKTLFNRKTVTFFGSGPLRNASLCYYDVAHRPKVTGFVALTIDDAPCRQGRSASMVQMVRALLRKYNAKVTFMLISKHATGHEEDLVDLLNDGHELGNHGVEDRPYHEEDEAAFEEAVSKCTEKIRSIQRRAGVKDQVSWFRAPHGKYTLTMEKVLSRKGLTNVMCDTYACCPVIQDGAFIGDALANYATHGSIILVHMPEHGFRDWCYTALEHVLEGLSKRGLQAVTVSELAMHARSQEC